VAPAQAVPAGIAEAHRGDLLFVPPRFELVTLRGTPLVLAYFGHTSGEAVRSFSRLEWESSDGHAARAGTERNGEGDRISRLCTYLHSPEALREICAELNVPCRTNGYRNW
ncbi:MAG TPA: hypothetical protein VFU02_06845, partial [Polyangiaceae bacterium]|nr:hypothetical protein [Polyangiaceae bacterium]